MTLAARAAGGLGVVLVLSAGAGSSEARLQPPAVPPPPSQRTADCAVRAYATDALVCDDPPLLDLDRQLARAYEAAAQSSTPTEGSLLEAPEAWLRRRSLCAFSTDHRRCVVAAYRERLTVVQALLATRAGTVPLLVRCGEDRWQGRHVRIDDGVEALVLQHVTGRLAGVALPVDGSRAWRAFVGFRPGSDARALTLVRGDDLQGCTVATALRTLSNGDLRQRAEAIDGLAERATADLDSRALDATAFASVVRWLYDQELTVHAEVRLRTFSDAATHNYWHRGRLKFPTATAQALKRLEQR